MLSYFFLRQKFNIHVYEELVYSPWLIFILRDVDVLTRYRALDFLIQISIPIRVTHVDDFQYL